MTIAQTTYFYILAIFLSQSLIATQSLQSTPAFVQFHPNDDIYETSLEYRIEENEIKYQSDSNDQNIFTFILKTSTQFDSVQSTLNSEYSVPQIKQESFLLKDGRIFSLLSAHSIQEQPNDLRRTLPFDDLSASATTPTISFSAISITTEQSISEYVTNQNRLIPPSKNHTIIQSTHQSSRNNPRISIIQIDSLQAISPTSSLLNDIHCDFSSLTCVESPMPRRLGSSTYASSNAMFQLVTNKTNVVVLEVLQDLKFLMEMQTALSIEIKDIQYTQVIRIKTFDFMEFTFTFEESVPQELEVFFAVVHPTKIQPSPILDQLSIKIRTEYFYNENQTKIEYFLAYIVQFACLLINFIFIITTPFQQSFHFQSLIFFVQGIFQIAAHNQFIAPNGLKKFFLRVQSGVFNIMLSSDYFVFDPSYDEYDDPYAIPTALAETHSHLEQNLGFYVLVMLALLAHFICYMVVRTERYSHYADAVRETFRMYAYLSIIFLTQFSVIEDVVYRIVNSTYSELPGEQFIVIGVFVIFGLFPIYVLPLIHIYDKEVSQFTVSTRPLSFLYLNVEISELKKADLYYVPMRMTCVLLSQLIRFANAQVYLYFLLLQHTVFIAFIVKEKPHNHEMNRKIDLMTSICNLLQTLILLMIEPRNGSFSEQSREMFALVMIIISVVQILTFPVLYLRRFNAFYTQYIYERDYGKKIVPVGIFLPQTSTYQVKKKPKKEVIKDEDDKVSLDGLQKRKTQIIQPSLTNLNDFELSKSQSQMQSPTKRGGSPDKSPENRSPDRSLTTVNTFKKRRNYRQISQASFSAIRTMHKVGTIQEMDKSESPSFSL